MKVYSLYYKDTFVVAFPNREDTMDYGKKHYDEYAWDWYEIIDLKKWMYDDD